jgi:hypothetical protein
MLRLGTGRSQVVLSGNFSEGSSRVGKVLALRPRLAPRREEANLPQQIELAVTGAQARPAIGENLGRSRSTARDLPSFSRGHRPIRATRGCRCREQPSLGGAGCAVGLGREGQARRPLLRLPVRAKRSARRPVVGVLLCLERSRPPPRGYGPDAPTTARGGGVAPALPRGRPSRLAPRPGIRMSADSQLEITDLVCRSSSRANLKRELGAHADLLCVGVTEAASPRRQPETAARGRCGAKRRVDPRAHRRLPADA